ncbi:cobalt ECF transporter T component CbiQ [Flavonifractor sp. An82]|uniref:cobalt ECF transporter T component CbiQ n=1 Tax=Flavonifractor sp. An82 TaxID=1965660 RepID=UPI000B36FC3D|nr:cobalt ECF transporter T component CbiQ [Flavonifractor sp. An82]OUN21855.1 cobalt ECF transporter T component CbiQ [Flavonifractor sp. An82]
MGTDRYAYQSRLRRVSPMPKLLLTAVTLVVCLCCSSVAVGLATLVLMGVLITALGGLSPRVYLHFLKVPLVFLVIGCITIVAGSYRAGTEMVAALPVGERLWGFTADGLYLGAQIFCKAMGTIGCMYFLALNTPVTDLTMALEKLHVPRLLVELMELIYRFIFVLAETAEHIHTAQDSRLGYQGFRRSVSSLGMLASMVFLRSWRKAERIYTALESRGYTGSLTTLADQYRPGWGLLPLTALAAAGQIAIWFVEGRLLP